MQDYDSIYFKDWRQKGVGMRGIMDWIFVSPQNAHVEALTPQCDLDVRPLGGN